MNVSEISIKVDESPEIKQYLEENGQSCVNELLKNALKEYLENGAKNEENQVDKWIRILNELVEWANTKCDKMEGDL